MKPPYNITPEILELISSVSEKIGEIKAANLQRTPAELRKKNRIRTIHSSLAIEGNTLTEEQVTAIIENKRVLGRERDIVEVRNAIRTYGLFETFSSVSQKHFLRAHGELTQSLLVDAGKYRKQTVGIIKGKKLAHVAPPAHAVASLMSELFSWLKATKENALIKSCVFHYELLFIHPFTDGNGRMARLWQSLILNDKYPVFGYLPIETLIRNSQKKYYAALSASDKTGESNPFIVFMLQTIERALEDVLISQRVSLKSADRIAEIPELFADRDFSRKDYLRQFKGISTATASRDLQEAVEQKMIRKVGNYNQSRYKVSRNPRRNN